MPDVGKAETDAFAERNDLIVRISLEKPDRIHRVFHCVYRLYSRKVSALCRLSLRIFRFLRLNMRTVAEHDVAQVFCGFRRYDRSSVAVVIELRQHARMVNVRMRNQHIVDIGRIDRQRLIHEIIMPLFHTAVDQDVFACRAKEMTASRHLMIRADECKFHKTSLCGRRQAVPVPPARPPGCFFRRMSYRNYCKTCGAIFVADYRKLPAPALKGSR